MDGQSKAGIGDSKAGKAALLGRGEKDSEEKELMEEDLWAPQQWHCNGAPDCEGTGLCPNGEIILAHALYRYEGDGSSGCFRPGKNSEHSSQHAVPRS